MDSVIVLIAAPQSGAISVDIARAIGGRQRWLSQGEALEVSGVEPTHVKAIVARSPIDVNEVPLANRRKKLLIADMDSTMIHQECIDELGFVAGVGEHIKGITARAMRGEIDFEGALKERVSLLKGLDESVIAELLSTRITYMEGGQTLLATMKDHGAYCALVSGGFTGFTGHVAEHLGFHENRANTLMIDNGKLSGDVALPILGKEAKVKSLHRICKERGILPSEVLAVGDGANDIPMLLEAGLGVALHAKPAVQAQARHVINHGDLTALLYLQGYAAAEFISGEAP